METTASSPMSKWPISVMSSVMPQEPIARFPRDPRHLAPEISPFDGWVWRENFPQSSRSIHGPPSPGVSPHDKIVDGSDAQSSTAVAQNPASRTHLFPWLLRRSHDLSGRDKESVQRQNTDKSADPETRRWKQSSIIAKIRAASHLGDSHIMKKARIEPPDAGLDSALQQHMIPLTIRSDSTTAPQNTDTQDFYYHRAENQFGLGQWMEDEEDQEVELESLNIPAHLPSSPLCPNSALSRYGNDANGARIECPLHRPDLAGRRTRHTR